MGNCGSALTKPCLSESDKRYDANYPKTIVEQDPRWEKFAGYFKEDINNYDPVNGGGASPGPYIPDNGLTDASPFGQDKFVGFTNVTLVGSRLILNRYNFKPPAGPEFCAIPFAEPMLNARPGSECGVNGHADFGSTYASLNHEHDGTLTIGRVTGMYAPDTPEDLYNSDDGSFIKLTGENTIETSFMINGLASSTRSYVFFDDNTAAISAIITLVPMKVIMSAYTATRTRLTEEEFLAGIQEYSTAFAVPEAVPSPMTSDELSWYPGVFPTEDEWCGGIVNDVSCTPSPYQEPDAQLKAGFIALFVILGVLIVAVGGTVFHRNAIAKQKNRYKEHFVRGIARNITIADSAGLVDPEQLKKEFDSIDKDGGGTISKDELKEFLKSGKVGDISDKDIEAMWAAIDIDNSGEVDFVEFIAFLGTCGNEFEATHKEQKAMTKDEKLTYASQRLSMRVLSVPKDDE